MSLDEYKLSTELLGHSLDVRSVAAAENYIVSGSRDKTAKVWEYNGETWSERFTLTNHTNFVSAVCILGDEWICTASNDATICVYAAGNNEPFQVLKGHEMTVSCLAPGLEDGTLISGSWDKTAIVWKFNGFSAPDLMKLEGHEAAVWAVTTLNTGKYVTGAADKNIIYWSSSGEKLKVLKGSKDCVRSLLGLPNNELISAGNDAVIRYWNEDGECVKELAGHTNYIYTIAFNKAIGDNIVVSGAEDSTIRMWGANGELGNAITLPAQTVWSVTCMKNGDIVAGASDGVVRIFTRDANRFASEAVMAAFNQAVEIRIREANASLGGVKVNELPGPEALWQKGKADGQTKMIRHPDGKIMCYQWTNGKWEPIGDVVGASGGSQESSGKKLFEGKEYDYVFSIDIADDIPAIKLPYNRTEDPWFAAQTFIEKFNLPQTYLDQIANFIIDNSAPPPMSEAAQCSEYQDPFTGSGRYIPGSGSNVGQSGGNVDPFTGGSSYSTTGANAPSVNFVPRSGRNLDPFTGASSHTSQSGKTAPKHFPFSHYTTLDYCDSERVLKKLREFNEQVPDARKVTNEELEQAIKFARNDHTASSSIDALKKLLAWPKEFLFPVLDVVRLAVIDPNTCTHLVTPDILNFIVQNCNTGAANQLMSLRCLSNMLHHGYGRGLLDTCLPNILVAISSTRKGTNNLQSSIATLLLNLSVAQTKRPDEATCSQINESLIDFLLWNADSEALYRAYRALGNLLTTPHAQTISAQIISTDEITESLRENTKAPQPYGFEKINEIAQEILDTL